MKKFLVVLLVLVVGFAAFANGTKEATTTQGGVEAFDPALVAAAQAEGELVVYGGCEELYLSAACEHFADLFGIKVSYQRLSTSEIQAKVEEENGNPSADVSFGGTTDPYNLMSAAGLLETYDAKNASHITKPAYMSKDKTWYGIYTGILGFMVNTDELKRLGLEAPKDFADLTDPKYKDLIWLSNYQTAGTALLFLNTIIQKYGFTDAMKYFVDLDKNIEVYTKSGSGPSKNVGTGECVIGIGFLHDGIKQIVDDGYTNIDLIIPSSGTTCEVGATAILKGAKHPNAAKLWVEYALSPECVGLADDNESYQFLVIDNVEQPKQALAFGLDPNNVMDYDFDAATKNSTAYKAAVMAHLASQGVATGDTERFQIK